MPNKNYIAGRRFEYDTIKAYVKQGYRCIRASGSHGEYDVVAYRANHKPLFIQCKKVNEKSTGNLLSERFADETKPELHFHQVMRIKVKGVKDPIEVWV